MGSTEEIEVEECGMTKRQQRSALTRRVMIGGQGTRELDIWCISRRRVEALGGYGMDDGKGLDG